jgi:hypothetical protein
MTIKLFPGDEIYRFVKMVCECNSHNSGPQLSSCLVLKYDVSEIGFWFYFQVKPTKMGP